MFEILSNRSIVEVKGEQPISFLQHLTTNDLTKLKYCYTYMLSSQGRYLFDFFLYNIDDKLVIIDINKNSVEDFIVKLNFYKLRAKLDFKISDNYKVLYSSVKLEKDVIYSYKDPRFEGMGFRSLVYSTDYFESQTEDSLYLNDKYNYGIPDGYEDLIFNKSIPIEYGAEELNSINYQKGCYVGQEVISRTKYQGVIRKKIYKLIANEKLDKASKNSELRIGDTNVGIYCSHHQDKAIVLIREELIHKMYEDSITIDNISAKLITPKWRQT